MYCIPVSGIITRSFCEICEKHQIYGTAGLNGSSPRHPRLHTAGIFEYGPLAITFNTIPVAIAAIALGPVGGIVAGGVFGLTSFLQCFGGSVLGTTLFGISPILTVFQCFVPRMLDGLLIRFLNAMPRKHCTSAIANCAVTSFCCFPEHALLHEQLDSVVWKNGHHPVLSGNTCTRKKCLSVRLCLCRHKCHCKWVFFRFSWVQSGPALTKAKLVPAPKAKLAAAE